MAKYCSTKYRKKRAVYQKLRNFNNYISTRYAVPAIASEAETLGTNSRVIERPDALLTPAETAAILGVAEKHSPIGGSLGRRGHCTS